MGKQSPEQVRKTFWESTKDLEEGVRGFAMIFSGWLRISL